ncbi:MAG: DEAD/DEAH box helicase [Clostridia bacterium]|nr:DEAD/DEAH box helicase [Clostridia bacterium]
MLKESPENVWNLYAPFIRNFIYAQGWQSLHEIQLEAAEVLFRTDYHLLLPTSTASGKTEAAFFPILSMMYENPPKSVGCLYIAPLKALINDQFDRITVLTEEAGIPVTHWHGDVPSSQKNRLLSMPSGVLQITPESLESLLMRLGPDVVRLFCDLSFIVIDEIHTLTGTDRGNQILCLISRLEKKIGRSPRRIGLSATVGDPEKAAKWLGEGTDRETYVPEIPHQSVRWKFGMEHFTIASQPAAPPTGGGKYTAGTAAYLPVTEEQILSVPVPEGGEKKEWKAENFAADPGYLFLYHAAREKKSLVFSNSREETERVTATLRQIARMRGEEDIFLIHHGNLSAALREEAEMKMKDDAEMAVTCATVTMELGIDIGKLERVFQMGAPNSVSAFLQRLGRSGRRGNPPEMLMIFREEEPLPNAPLPELIPWELIKGIAVVQLYLEERYIEPPKTKHLPFSLLFQQTLSVLTSAGAMTPKRLAENVLSLPPFREVSREDYREMLQSMAEQDILFVTEEGELLPGAMGERLTSSFKFFAVFKESEDFTVRCRSDEIGTITTPPPVGDRFALAGRVWEVEEIDLKAKLIYVKPVEGKMDISWPGDAGETDTRILERMRRVLEEDTDYPYLLPGAKKRLENARAVARITGLTRTPVIHLGGYTWAIFPWLGTRSFRTLRKAVAARGGVSGIEYEGCYYMMMKLSGSERDGKEFFRSFCRDTKRNGLDLAPLVGEKETPCFEKYDPFLPGDLLRKAYREDKLRSDEILARLSSGGLWEEWGV